jgi:tetratricopeptide (TPR) repeat protein
MKNKHVLKIAAGAFAVLIFLSGEFAFAKDKDPAPEKIPAPTKPTAPKMTIASVAKLKKIPAFVKSGEVRYSRDIVGMTDTDLEYVEQFTKKSMPLNTIESVDFITDYDRYKAKVLERKKDYSGAAALTVQSLSDVIPYISLPENNIVDPLFDAGYLYLDAASVYANIKSPQHDKAKADKEYKNAYWVFKKIEKAKWYFGAKIAELNAILCQIRLGELDLAVKNFSEVDEPAFGDAAFGVYWMIDAMIKFKQSKLSEALDSAVKSIVFDTKNINTFPESLLLSGYCYEDMLDNYRARDVYFEAAKLFRDTTEGDIAFSSSQFIRDKKLTAGAEPAGLEKVFFNAVEDTNKKMDDFIVVILEERRIKEEQRKEKEKKEKEAKEAKQ